MSGTFCLVLHTHLPYVRRNGVWPSGEDFFHQAAVESYLPVLGVLQRLSERGIRQALTIGLSPMVVHQMRDDHMRRELDLYLGRYELRALRQVANYEGAFATEFKELAAFYARFARDQSALLDDIDGIARGFDALERAGAIEILGGPATHPYLPLVRQDALARAQIALGATEHARAFGRVPTGMWLPECAYDPVAGIEQMLQKNDVGHVVVDGPTMLRSAGPGSTFTPRRIGSSDVVAFARNLDVTYRVWSPTGGYPAGTWYRDFYAYDLEGGFKNWRVTSIHKPVSEKRPYEVETAAAAAKKDAEDFVALITGTLDAYERETEKEGLLVAAYDTELFGHWWFEGPAFLEHVFELLSETDVRARSLRAAREQFEAEPVELSRGSWGFRKDDRSWVAPETEHMWETLQRTEAETMKLARALAPGDALSQLIREAMLMQSSDWPFMVLRGRNPEYARERFYKHHERWAYLAEHLRAGTPSDHIGIYDADNILPHLTARDLI